jgi:imidazolonepropionase-like amidohydrolase
MLADFVIVEGDPSMNLNDLRKVKMVVKDGEIVFEK